MAGAESDNRPTSFIPQEELVTATAEAERIQSNCGLFAMIDVSGSIGGYDLADATYRAGKKVQHRAEGDAGYGVFDSRGSGEFVRGKGKIDVAFQNGRLIPIVPDGRIAIIHTRYPTSGDSDHMPNIQPMSLDEITLAHHGNLTNAKGVRDRLGKIEWGGNFPDNDSWVALNAIARAEGQSLEERMVNAQRKFEGGWAFIATDGKGIVASRDPEGIRPLFFGVIGSWENPKAFALAVEDSALKVEGLEIDTYREVLPGETISIKGKEAITVDLSPAPNQRSCIFEIVYMMDPDSKFMGHNIATARIKAGELLWQENPIHVEEGDQITIMPVPDSGRDYETGYFRAAHRALGNRVDRVEGLKKKRYEGRSFIQPTGKRNPSERFMVIPELVKGKKVLLVDDTLVRGDTMGGGKKLEGLVFMLRNAGASEVHVRLGAPAIVNPCYWGVAFPTREELSAHNYPDINERARILGVDSLGYLSLNGLFEACGADNETREKFCTYCFGGNGPRKVPTSLGIDSGTIDLIELKIIRK
ncbi:MAG: hypothetical protein A3A51_03230 [Candidatus Levybacteria bacterium RIFCSPLOWO2_01_FULL_39_10]|nr:MAG: hypothetical protein A3A51_03230 [Candidatus Levybacteria bacterium RIFCSPLOWO2_01_FULL_39_10]